jgi:hypothetical protein
VKRLNATHAALAALFRIELAPTGQVGPDDDLSGEMICRLCSGKGKLYVPHTVDCFFCHGSGLQESRTPAAMRARALARAISLATR